MLLASLIMVSSNLLEALFHILQGASKSEGYRDVYSVEYMYILIVL